MLALERGALALPPGEHRAQSPLPRGQKGAARGSRGCDTGEGWLLPRLLSPLRLASCHLLLSSLPQEPLVFGELNIKGQSLTT